jgi:hypothetical protein
MTRIHANQKMVGAARSPIRRLNEPEARGDPNFRRESAVADRRYQFVAATFLLVWICESVGPFSFSKKLFSNIITALFFIWSVGV